MPKPKELKEEEQATGPVAGSREARWEAFLEKAQAHNPVKFEQKKKNGEFETIPDSFK